MYLTLEVVSPQGASLGAQRRQLVGVQGLTIGRVDGNDWVIPDPYVSKRHARITFVNGAFFIEALGRNPIAIGTAQNVIPSNQPRPLKTGDRVFLDQYEILVTARQGDPPGAGPPPATISDDPFGTPAAIASKPAPAQLLIPEVWDGGSPVGGIADTSELDPLAALGGPQRPTAPDLPPVNWQQNGPLGDHFQPPPARDVGPRAGGLPENWDASILSPAAAPPRPPPAPRAPPGGGIPANWENSVMAPPSPSSEARRPRESGIPRPPPPPPASEPVPRPSPPVAQRQMAPAAPVARPADSAPVARPAQSPQALGGDPLAQLLQGAGLAERDLSPEVAQELGQVLRIVVQGVMDVLQARSDIKSQFRLPLTRIKPSENNPLKLSPNVESALHTLLVQRNPGYLTTTKAFEDAFADIRSHQMAMLEGVRAAFTSMLKSFDPETLEERFESGAKRGGVLGFGGGKAKNWELYTDWFARLAKDSDDTFRRLFGDVFAEAYEQQLARLKRLAAESNRK